MDLALTADVLWELTKILGGVYLATALAIHAQDLPKTSVFHARLAPDCTTTVAKIVSSDITMTPQHLIVAHAMESAAHAQDP